MNTKDNKISVIDYWADVERFTPHNLEVKNKLGNVKSIQSEVQGTKDIPWLNRSVQRNNHHEDKNVWVFTVFLGIVKSSDMTFYMKKMLNSSSGDYDLAGNENLTCFCSFQVKIKKVVSFTVLL
jgi:hypothetical protein